MYIYMYYIRIWNSSGPTPKQQNDTESLTTNLYSSKMIVEKTCWGWLLSKAVTESCWRRVLRMAQGGRPRFWGRLLRKAAEDGCRGRLLSDNGYWNVPSHSTTYYNAFQRTTVYYNVLLRIKTYCCILDYRTALYCSTAMYYRTIVHVALRQSSKIAGLHFAPAQKVTFRHHQHFSPNIPPDTIRVSPLKFQKKTTQMFGVAKSNLKF